MAPVSLPEFLETPKNVSVDGLPDGQPDDPFNDPVLADSIWSGVGTTPKPFSNFWKTATCLFVWGPILSAMYESLSAKDFAKFALLPPIAGILNRGLPVVVSIAQRFGAPTTGISLVYKISDHDMVVDTVVVSAGTVIVVVVVVVDGTPDTDALNASTVVVSAVRSLGVAFRSSSV